MEFSRHSIESPRAIDTSIESTSQHHTYIKFDGTVMATKFTFVIELIIHHSVKGNPFTSGDVYKKAVRYRDSDFLSDFGIFLFFEKRSPFE